MALPSSSSSFYTTTSATATQTTTTRPNVLRPQRHHHSDHPFPPPRGRPHNTAAAQSVLDLHGCTKVQAIQKLTFFLDRIRHSYYHNNNNYTPTSTHGNVPLQASAPAAATSAADAAARVDDSNMTHPVTIITGSGKHSADGPVLRKAVHDLLLKRQMTFHLNRGKGSFCVDALSGIDLVNREQMQQDNTKVVVVKEFPPGLIKMRSRNDQDVMWLPAGGSMGENEQTVGDNSSLYFPLPREVAMDDELIERVKISSQREAVQLRSLEIQEEKDVEKAVKESVEKMKDDMEGIEEQELQKVLELSEQQLQEKQKYDLEIQKEEEDLLKRALTLSLQLEKDMEDIQEQELQKVLELSQQQQTQHQKYDLEIQKEEEDLLKRALSLSLQLEKDRECTEEQELQKVLELSQQQQQYDLEQSKCIQKEDDLLKRALTLSLQLEKDRECIEEQELQKVLELSQQQQLQQKQKYDLEQLTCLHTKQGETETLLLKHALEISLQLENDMEERERLELEQVLSLSSCETQHTASK